MPGRLVTLRKDVISQESASLQEIPYVASNQQQVSVVGQQSTLIVGKGFCLNSGGILMLIPWRHCKVALKTALVMGT
jgi:hypothetical protein